MYIRTIGFSLMTALGVGCAVASTDLPRDNDAATGLTVPTDPTGPNTPDVVSVAPIWKPSSVHIRIRSGGYWDGSGGYDIDRSAMSPTQLEALNGLALLPVLRQETVSDASEWEVSIRDSDGTEASYWAVVYNAGASSRSEPVLDYYTLKPFLATYDCLRAGETRKLDRAGADELYPTDGGLPPTGPAWASAPKLPSDPSCMNGVFLPYECTDVWLQFVVDRPATYRIELAPRFESVAVELLGWDGSLLAASSPSPTPSVRYAFDTPGTYVVDVKKTNLAGCPSRGTAGDIIVRAIAE